MTLFNASFIEGVRIPDSGLARAIAVFIRDTEDDLLFNHATRVYLLGALAGRQRGLSFDADRREGAACPSRRFLFGDPPFAMGIVRRVTC